MTAVNILVTDPDPVFRLLGGEDLFPFIDTTVADGPAVQELPVLRDSHAAHGLVVIRQPVEQAVQLGRVEGLG